MSDEKKRFVNYVDVGNMQPKRNDPLFWLLGFNIVLWAAVFIAKFYFGL